MSLADGRLFAQRRGRCRGRDLGAGAGGQPASGGDGAHQHDEGNDPEAVMRKLIETRYPVYAEADITVESRDVPHEVIVDAVIDALGAKLDCKAKPPAQKAAKPGGRARKKAR